MNIFDTLIQAAKNKLTEADKAVGGWLPGGGVPNPASNTVRQVQQYTNILRDPATQLKNPKIYRAWQENLRPITQLKPKEYFEPLQRSFSKPTAVLHNPYTQTNVTLPISVEGFADERLDTGSFLKPSVGIHFSGPEDLRTRAEARKEFLKLGGSQEEARKLFVPTDPEMERAKSLALRAQLGRGMAAIQPETWINTYAKQTPYNSREKVYDRLTKGVFAVDPELGDISVYKESPTSWRNIKNPEKVIQFDPQELIEPLKREAFERPDLNSLRNAPLGAVVEAIGRRISGPQVQAVMFLDDIVRQMTGVSPAESVIEASSEQIRRSAEQQQRMGVQNPRIWQNAPF
jgi:hypothetical protein